MPARSAPRRRAMWSFELNPGSAVSGALLSDIDGSVLIPRVSPGARGGVSEFAETGPDNYPNESVCDLYQSRADTDRRHDTPHIAVDSPWCHAT